MSFWDISYLTVNTPRPTVCVLGRRNRCGWEGDLDPTLFALILPVYPPTSCANRPASETTVSNLVQSVPALLWRLLPPSRLQPRAKSSTHHTADPVTKVCLERTWWWGWCTVANQIPSGREVPIKVRLGRCFSEDAVLTSYSGFMMAEHQYYREAWPTSPAACTVAANRCV